MFKKRPKESNQKTQAGFTLIELLVVISIIGFLAAAAMVSVNVTRAKARDAKRIAEIRQLGLALQRYYDDNGAYPATGTAAKCLGLGSSATCWSTGTLTGSDSLIAALSPYVKIPFDPLYGRRAKGDVYLYASPASNTAWHCTGTYYPTGPFLVWVPDRGTALSDSSDCKNLGFYSCCGLATPCPENYSCFYQIQ